MTQRVQPRTNNPTREPGVAILRVHGQGTRELRINTLAGNRLCEVFAELDWTIGHVKGLVAKKSSHAAVQTANIARLW